MAERADREATFTDEAIVARVVAGDVASFELIVRRHNQRVFRTVRAILKSDDLAEDAMQDAYVAAFSHLADFDGRARFSTWLVRIAVHEALGRLRRSKRQASLDDESSGEDMMATTRSPEQAASDVELRALLEAAVDALPLGFRAVFVLRAVEDLSVGETAEALGIPEETVRTRLHRARGLLRDELARKVEGSAREAFPFHLSRCDRVTEGVLRRIRNRLAATRDGY
ncbi:RNA polymerase sigma-54 factor RpoN [Labilithrix luteola]|uniref:RNA polymerase sigma-54 factor RpoN n=1 Tax=Labilithrix luteola TaxID=1391654 RepID=A0A0K1QE05_9BACT|nr:RNA polymerase sigma factor [Labilithrix luteola]AKV03953.1 RNA polymerase sigma-54 factor RpoN [Labilithrix luteola]